MADSEIAAGDIVETVPSALIILDQNLIIKSANRAFYQTFRTSPQETEGSLIYNLGNRQWDIPALRNLLESVIPHRASVEGFEVEHDFPTIGRRTMLVNARKILRGGEHDGYILLAIEDVSEEREARKESKRTWQLTQSIVDTIRDPLVVLETDMTIVTASKAFLTIFGITQAETKGRRVSELLQHQWDVPALRHLMEKVLPENKPIESFEIEDVFPGLGRRVFNLNARKISQPGNHAHRMLLVFEDITDRKQRERDAVTLTNEISHRIKNNLQIIVGLIAFESRWTAAPCVQGYQAMQTRIGAIAQLYDLISQSSRGRTVAVGAYLEEIAKTVSASLLRNESGIKIEVKAEPLEIDPDRAVPFGLLVNELATNAIKHAFPDGTGRIVLSVEQVGDEIELCVTDNGIGMKDKDPNLPKAPEKRGSDYVAIFVRQLGGTIVPSAVEATGTIVRVRLPLLLAPSGGAEPIAA
ncbi:sensor histidine kinase [Terricaulis silvestris]|uniref:histidine kinase n=1 Tax=Terricaulis silvestris TaxID=2686094 RepID=A0A6I6MV50_9CAUL|nr:PAS domain-containing protein [Terricaulis silvestris]QGZ96324.1 Blue-light-activated histidine kinase 2 [Terricaulis silvestris]